MATYEAKYELIFHIEADNQEEAADKAEEAFVTWTESLEEADARPDSVTLLPPELPEADDEV